MTESTLLLRLAATQQSWGGVGTQSWRPTEKVPTRAGLEGLLAACLGHPRGVVDTRLTALSIHVRVDRAGTINEDFHTVSPAAPDITAARRARRLLADGGRPRADAVVPLGNGLPWQVSGEVHPLVTRRLSLADAEFIVAFTAGRDTIDTLAAAAHRPVFSPYLGRQAYAPQFPFHLGTRDGDGLHLLEQLPSAADTARALPTYRIDRTRPVEVARLQPPRTHDPLNDWRIP